MKGAPPRNPTSQLRALSLIHVKRRFCKTANTAFRQRPVSTLAYPPLATSGLRAIAAPMKILFPLIAVLPLLLAAPADAIVGGGVASSEGIGRAIVTIV